MTRYNKHMWQWHVLSVTCHINDVSWLTHNFRDVSWMTRHDSNVSCQWCVMTEHHLRTSWETSHVSDASCHDSDASCHWRIMWQWHIMSMSCHNWCDMSVARHDSEVMLFQWPVMPDMSYDSDMSWQWQVTDVSWQWSTIWHWTSLIHRSTRKLNKTQNYAIPTVRPLYLNLSLLNKTKSSFGRQFSCL